MLKRITICLISLLFPLSLVSCATDTEVGAHTVGATTFGAVTGAVIGGSLFHGSAAGAVGGAALGGFLGYKGGQKMDAQDQQRLQKAIITGNDDSWLNDKTHAKYTVKAGETTRKGTRYCREYQTTVTIGDETKKAYGTACQMPDGAWKMVN